MNFFRDLDGNLEREEFERFNGFHFESWLKQLDGFKFDLESKESIES